MSRHVWKFFFGLWLVALAKWGWFVYMFERDLNPSAGYSVQHLWDNPEAKQFVDVCTGKRGYIACTADAWRKWGVKE